MDKSRTRKKVIQIIIIIGVIIIPLLYSSLYLGAFWDPYSTLVNLPVAVVNNDKGAAINDKQRNLGQELCDELKEDNSLKFIFTDESTAQKGTEGKDYYAMLVIPSNFSEDVASSSEINKHTAQITFSANEKKNYLASQMLGKATLVIEESLRANINKEITAGLSNKLKEMPSQLQSLQNGLNELNGGFSEYRDGVAKASTGAAVASQGASSLDSGIGQLLSGATVLENSTQSLPQLTQGAKKLAESAKTFNTGLNTYTAGVDALIQNVSGTASFLKQYVGANPSLMKDPTFAAFISKMSSTELQTNIKALSDATLSLKGASTMIADGAAQLSAGTDNLPQLQAAVSQIKKGLAQAKDGSYKLSEGTAALNTGMTALNQAAGQLQDGVVTIKDGVDTSVADASAQIKSLDGLDEYAAKPVTVKSKSINPVPNYGTAFAPYFMSLSLWVGALVIFVGTYLDSQDKFNLLSRNSNNKIKRTFVFLLIGLVQAVVLSVILKLCLGLQVNNLLYYYLSCCLVSVVFLSIVQFLIVFMDDIGKFLAILILILQLTSCGGTFPMETVPALFNKLYPYMPMTYSVTLFREAISGGDMNIIMANSGILLAICVVFTALTVIVARYKKTEKAAKRNKISKKEEITV